MESTALKSKPKSELSGFSNSDQFDVEGTSSSSSPHPPPYWAHNTMDDGPTNLSVVGGGGDGMGWVRAVVE